jgi:carboxypeptidase C (cathepsin A)
VPHYRHHRPPLGDFIIQLYSGYLNVPGPVAGYDSLKIHYEFHTSINDPTTDPVTTWHQGGPGGSSLYGAYGEMGYLNGESSFPIH